MHSGSDVRPGSRFVAAVLAGLLCSATIAPYAQAQGAPAKHSGKKPAAAAAAPAAPKATSAAGSTAASMTDAQKKAAARKHYEEGIKKLDAKDFSAALAEFKVADEMVPAAAAKHKMALCLDGLGRTGEAIAQFETFLSQANPEKMKEQIEQATARVAALRATPGTVRVASEPVGAKLDVDGSPQGITPTDLKLAPGKHKVRASADGYEPAVQEVTIAPGEKAADLTVTLTKKSEPTAILPPNAPPPGAGAPAASPTPASAPTSEPQKTSDVPGYVSLGIAGAGLVVGTIFGVKALSDKNKFDDSPTASNADNAERNALIADMAFGAAVTFGVTGAVLLWGKKSPEQRATRTAPVKSMHLTPVVGPHGGGAAALWRF